ERERRERLDRAVLEVGDRQIEGGGISDLVNAVVIDIDNHRAVGPAAAAERSEPQIREGDPGARSANARRAHYLALRAAIRKRLLNGRGQLAVRSDPAEQTLVIGKAQNALGAVVDAARGVADESRDRGRNPGDRARQRRKLFDINAGKGWRDSHGGSFSN